MISPVKYTSVWNSEVIEMIESFIQSDNVDRFSSDYPTIGIYNQPVENDKALNKIKNSRYLKATYCDRYKKRICIDLGYDGNLTLTLKNDHTMKVCNA